MREISLKDRSSTVWTLEKRSGLMPGRPGVSGLLSPARACAPKKEVAETMATRERPSGMIDRREIDAKIAALEAARLAEGRPSASFATPLKS